MQVNIGSNSNFAWRSIYNAKWVIQKGSCWRIGNGQSVNIWNENWIPSHHNFKVFSPHRDTPEVKLVSDLIHPTTKNRNTDKMSNNLLATDISVIEQIPLINTQQNDELMWMYESKGYYIVKSGYTAIQLWKPGTHSSPSSSNRDIKLWKNLWNLHTIPRHNPFAGGAWERLSETQPV